MEYTRPVKVGFYQISTAGGGVSRVLETTINLLAEREPHIEFVLFTSSLSPGALVLSPTAKLTIHLLPDNTWHSDRISISNQEAISKYINAHGLDLLMTTIVQEFPSIIRERAPHCKIYNWMHSMLFWEYYMNREMAKQRSTRSMRFFLTWHLKHRWQIGELNMRRIKERYRASIEAFDKTIYLCSDYVVEVSQTLSLPTHEQSKLTFLTNVQEVNPNPVLDKEKLIVFVGRMNYTDKRPDRLVKIWEAIHKALPDWSVEFYGDGPEKARLEQYVRRRSIPRLKFCGSVQFPQQAYDRASILCLTSTFEGWGLVLCEAQNNGCIPVAFDCSSGVRQIIGTDERTGILIKPFDCGQYAHALQALCLDQDRRLLMQQACLVKREEYSLQVGHQQWRALLQEL